MGIYTEAIQKLYVAYFNRPADAAGLAYWENAVANAKGSTTAISAAFATSAEYKAAYAGMDEYHVVAQVYQNLFGRAPELSGLNFWGQALINKQMTVDNVVTMIAAGAQGTDLAAYNAKVSAATTFTAALDTSDKVLAYSGDKANGVAKSFLASVVDATTLANAISTATLGQVISDVMAAAPQQVGVTYTLTAGMDTLVGTAGNDVFNVYTINPTTGVTTANLSAFDTIDGSAGKDTLNIQIAGATNTLTGLTAVSKNVETINISADASNAVDASLFQGATLINQIGNAGAVTNLANGATAGYQGATITGALTVGAAGASAGVSFNGVADTASVAVSGSTLNSVTVSGSRVHVGGGTVAGLGLGVTVGKDVQSLTLNTNQKTTLTVTENAATVPATGKHITTIDASASTGAVTYDGTAQTTVLNVKTGSGNDTVTVAGVTAAATSTAAAVNASISTGAGNDTIVVKTTGTGMTTVDAGAGDDTITVNKVGGHALNVNGGEGNDTITIVGTIETTDVIDGGAGSNTVSMAGAATRAADDYIVFNKLLKNFSTLQFTGATAETGLEASQLAANYTTIDFNTTAGTTIVTKVGSQALIAHGNLTATATGFVANDTYAGTLNVTEKAAGTITANADVLSLAVKAASSGNVAAGVAGDVQSAIVTLTNTVDSTTTPTADRIASVTIDNTAALAGLKSITLSGAGSAAVTNAGGALASVDASALGGTLTFAGTTSIGLNYTSTQAKAEIVKLGSGIDNVKMNASTYGNKGDAIDTVVGLNLVAKADGSALAATSDSFHVGAAATFTKFTTTQTDLDLALKDAAAFAKANTTTDLVFSMGGDTYVFRDTGATAGSVDSGDVIVKLVGSVSLDALVLALKAPVV